MLQPSNWTADGISLLKRSMQLIRVCLRAGCLALLLPEAPVSTESEVLLTSLLDRKTFPADVFADLYHRRWGIETDYRRIKQTLGLDNFSGRSVTAVKQDFYAGQLLKNLALLMQHLLQPVIDVSPDATKGWMRVRAWNFEGVAGERQDMSAGIYENTYVKEDGVWKIASLVYCESWRVDYLGDLNRTPIPEYPLPAPMTYPEDPHGPDKVSNYNCRPWPYVGITPPMHYPHPVTGDYIHKP